MRAAHDSEDFGKSLDIDRLAYQLSERASKMARESSPDNDTEPGLRSLDGRAAF